MSTALQSGTQIRLRKMRAECAAELARLAEWWQRKLPRAEGGYHGGITPAGTPDPDMPVSVILMTRLLWFYSAAAGFLQNEGMHKAADRAADWLHAAFLDAEHGGVVWSGSPAGDLVDGRKHAYAQGFAIYALSRHYRETGDARSLDTAKHVFRDLEARFRDEVHGGYREAFGRDWQPLEDFRLSEKEGFAPKTMNTHLHILEAYTELARSWRDEAVLSALRHCLDIHLDRILDTEHWRLRLFLQDDWKDVSEAVSFGHDIEASWLLWDAADLLGDTALTERLRPVAVVLAEAVRGAGMGPDGGVFNERRLADGALDTDRIWWVQAEAIAGFLNAYALSGRAEFAEAALAVWDFTRAHIIDPVGEWRWYSSLDDRPEVYWASAWKACYHNGRAMMEAIRRIDALTGA